MAVRTGGANIRTPQAPRGGGGQPDPRGAPQQPNIESLMQVMGPEWQSQYKLDVADRIIEALMESQGRSGKSKPSNQSGSGGAPSGQTAHTGTPAERAPGPAQQTPEVMPQPGLGAGFFKLFNSSPQNLQMLSNSIVGARRRPAGMI